MAGSRLVGWAVDTAVLRHAVRGSGATRPALSGLTRLADSLKLWFGIAGVATIIGGRAGRRSATRGLSASVTSSALANAPLKRLVRRSRPHGLAIAGITRAGRPPRTSSFPSGHASSGFAFATAAGLAQPALIVPLESLALAVAWSRVVSGQHYPSDVASGAVVGIATGLLVHLVIERASRARHAAKDAHPVETVAATP